MDRTCGDRMGEERWTERAWRVEEADKRRGESKFRRDSVKRESYCIAKSAEDRGKWRPDMRRVDQTD